MVVVGRNASRVVEREIVLVCRHGERLGREVESVQMLLVVRSLV